MTYLRLFENYRYLGDDVMDKDQGNPHQDRIQRGMTADIPHIYFNGFAVAIGAGDLTMVLERNNVPVATLNLSFTEAKTLAQKLGGLVALLEEKSGNTIMTTDDIGSYLLEQPPELKAKRTKKVAKKASKKVTKKTAKRSLH